jgi:hypothetical protein
VGTCVGAINGAILAADPQGAAHRLAHSWSRLDASGVFPRSVMGPLRALRFPSPRLGALRDSGRHSREPSCRAGPHWTRQIVSIAVCGGVVQV